MIPEGTVVKPGDELAHRWGGDWSLVQVVHVTPTGRITLTDGEKYNERGHPMKKYGTWSSRPELSPVSDAIRQHIARQNNLSTIKRVKWEQLDNATLSRVVEALQPSE